MSDYEREARNDAVSFFDEYKDVMVDALVNGGKVSDDLYNDYSNGDGFIHETYTDKWYDLRDAVDVLEDLDRYEETDSGLWDGQGMKEALGTCAAYTYCNAVVSFIQEAIGTINDNCESIVDEYNDDDCEWEEGKDEDTLRARLSEEIESVLSDYKS
jgi:hypothetical protein